MRTIAIIPARGGSKRIERKNIKEFAGLPIIAYSIREAVRCGCFDEIMVSTDDDEIASVAREYGASVPFMRSAETSDDFATTADVIREVLAEYEKRGERFDALACIYATAPFITAARLRDAFGLIESGRTQAAFTCVEYSYPIQRSLIIDGDGRVSMKFPQYAVARSQDMQKSYHDAGQFYFITVGAFEAWGSLWGSDTMPIILPETEVQDLDTPTDWKLAEMKFSLLGFPARFSADGYEFVSYPELDEATSELMRDGRNNKDVRMQMVNTGEISLESHKKFVEGLKSRRDKQYYAVYCNHDLIGSVTLERAGTDTMERGIWLFESHRCKGHAKRMLRSLYEYLSSQLAVKTIETKVRKENEASQALENSLGAKKVAEDPNFLHYTLTLP